jgi:hypothetical protein
MLSLSDKTILKFKFYASNLTACFQVEMPDLLKFCNALLIANVFVVDINCSLIHGRKENVGLGLVI